SRRCGWRCGPADETAAAFSERTRRARRPITERAASPRTPGSLARTASDTSIPPHNWWGFAERPDRSGACAEPRREPPLDHRAVGALDANFSVGVSHLDLRNLPQAIVPWCHAPGVHPNASPRAP